MTKKLNKIEELFDVIKDYSLSVHKLTFRYGIDYVKCNILLKERHSEIFSELEEYFTLRNVIFIYRSYYPNKNVIECGNNYELNSMIAVPKATQIPINENETIIEDLEWVLLENLTDKEITEYKNKLTLLIEI